MDNMNKIKGKVRTPEERSKTFLEVELGYTNEEAKMEAERCLQCNNPRCMQGCPVNIKIPEFINAIKEGNIKKAYEVISESSSLPGGFNGG